MPNPDSRPPHDSDASNERGIGPLTRFRLFFARLWRAIREVAELLRPTRFSIFVVVAGAALLLMNAQGREIAVGLVDAPVLWAGVAFHVCVFLWAFESWYWARLMMEMALGADRTLDPEGKRYRPCAAWVKQHCPRIIAAAAYLVAGIALLLAGAWGHLISVVIAGSLFYWLLVRRLWFVAHLLRRISANLSEKRGAQLRYFIGDPKDQVSSLHDLPLLSKVILTLSLAFSVLITAFVLFDVVSFGWFLGAAAVPFLGFALIVPVGSVLVYWSRFGGQEGSALGAKGYPVVTMLFLWAALVGLIVDNHQVRTSGPVSGDRIDLATAAEQWHEQAVNASGSSEPPMVIVATAGGGIRAAYWTATVLGRLQDEAPNFRNYLFGISGVSGGSLGATAFVTLLADSSEGLSVAPCKSQEKDAADGGLERSAYECAGQKVLGQDFLAPTVAAFLFPDLMQRFVPVAVFPDRAKALEQGWERAWKTAGFSEDTWTGRNFSQLWSREPNTGYLPALLLNGTHVESGKRIITSNLKIDGSGFRDTYDFYKLSSGDLLPSTAALNSARFTYVSPAGTLKREDKQVGHIVDGGYFENFGAVTAQDMLNAVLDALAAKGKKARPVLIQISNEPRLGEDDLDVDRITPFDREPSGWANETLSPLRAMLNTRSARGVLAYKQFLGALDDQERRAHFRLCSVDGYTDPALGWVLAPGSKKLMQELIRNDACGNDSEFSKVLKAIR